MVNRIVKHLIPARPPPAGQPCHQDAKIVPAFFTADGDRFFVVCGDRIIS